MWEQPECPLTTEWISKMWSLRTVEYYSAFRREQILPHATAWITSRVLCRVKYAGHKKADAVYGCTYLPKVIRIMGTESRTVVARDWVEGRGGGKGEFLFMERVSVYQMKRATEVDGVVTVTQHCECAQYR